MPSVVARAAEAANDLDKRYYSSCNGYGYYYSYSYGGCYYSGWNAYGRWILLAVILVLAFVVFLSCSCINARRRRKRGVQPINGTGWMAPPAYSANNNNAYPMNNGQQQQYQPPSYAPPANHGGANADYYGGQEGGVTAPAGTYQPNRGGENVYAPPAGPPPQKY